MLIKMTVLLLPQPGLDGDGDDDDDDDDDDGDDCTNSSSYGC